MENIQFDDFEWLISLYVRKYAGLCNLNRACDQEDLAQAGRVGILKAVKTFDEERGALFATWAGYHISHEIRRALGLASGRELPLLVSLDEPVSADDPEGETRLDLVADDSIEPFDVAPYREYVQEKVRDALAAMPEDVAQAVELTQMGGVTRKAAAARMGVDEKKLGRLLARGRRTLFNDKTLRALALEEMTPYYKAKGVSAFFSSGSSVVEDIIEKRDYLRTIMN